MARQAALFTVAELGHRGGGRGRPSSACAASDYSRSGRAAKPIERWSLEKSRELLAFLVAQGGASVAREVVAEALWPDYTWDTGLKHTLSNIASTLRSTLRAAIGDDAAQPLFAVRQRLQLPRRSSTVDLDTHRGHVPSRGEFPDPEALSEYERALSLYAGDFLEGEFFTWLDSYRLDYRQRLIDAARRAAADRRCVSASRRARPRSTRRSSSANRPTRTRRAG